MSDIYHGPERRIHSDDHDTIITMLQLLNSHVNNFNEQKQIFKEHVAKDDENFNRIITKLEKQDDALDTIKRYIYIGIGIMVAVQGFPIVISIIKTIHGG